MSHVELHSRAALMSRDQSKQPRLPAQPAVGHGQRRADSRKPRAAAKPELGEGNQQQNPTFPHAPATAAATPLPTEQTARKFSSFAVPHQLMYREQSAFRAAMPDPSRMSCVRTGIHAMDIAIPGPRIARKVELLDQSHWILLLSPTMHD